MSMTKIAISFIMLIAVTTSLCQADCKYLLDGDLNKDCQVDFYDFSILAQQWLVDCNELPLDPACRCDIPWVAEPPMNVPRDQFTGGVIDGRIYVFGGNGNPNGIDLKSTEKYDPSTMLWSMVANNEHNGGRGVEELTSAVMNGKLYVFGAHGGYGPGGYYGVFNFNEVYDPATNGWTTLTQKPTLVTAAPTTVYNGEIYLFGGYFDSDNPSQNHVNYGVVESYKPSNNTWRSVTNMPKVITNFAVATIGSKAYVFGGYDPSTGHVLSDVITYDFQSGMWTTSGYAPLPVRRAFVYSRAAPIINGRVYIIGGGDVTGGIQDAFVLSKRVDIYNPATNTWEEGTSLPLPLDNYLSVVVDSEIYIMGGDNNRDFVNRAKAEVISLDTEFCNK